MIKTLIVLQCDGPGCGQCISEKEITEPCILRRAAIDLRGWARFRVLPSGPLGDYCPDCIKKIEALKSANAKTRRRS